MERADFKHHIACWQMLFSFKTDHRGIYCPLWNKIHYDVFTTTNYVKVFRLYVMLF